MHCTYLKVMHNIHTLCYVKLCIKVMISCQHDPVHACVTSWSRSMAISQITFRYNQRIMAMGDKNNFIHLH